MQNRPDGTTNKSSDTKKNKGGWSLSLRLSNANWSNTKRKLGWVAGLIGFSKLQAVGALVIDETVRNSYGFVSNIFGIKNSRYKFLHIDNGALDAFNESINRGACGANPNVDCIPVNFQSLQHWVTNYGGKFAELLRGANETVNESEEECIKGLIQDSLTEYNSGRERSDHIGLYALGIGLSAIFGITVLGWAGYKIYSRYRGHQTGGMNAGDRLSDDDADWEAAEEGRFVGDNEDGQAPMAASSSAITTSVRPQSIFKPKVVKSNAKQLKELGVPSEKIPDEFICPITKKIMTDPVCTDDGHSYERKALENHKRINDPAKCPLNRDIELKTIVPNTNLRRDISNFMEKTRNALVKVPPITTQLESVAVMKP